MSPFVLVLMYILGPVAWPTAKLLDWLLGEDHGQTYKKAGLKTLVSLHRSMGEAGQRLHADEVTIISAVLDLKEKTIGSIMTPMEDVFTLSLDDILDEPTMDDILSQGYSRIPVHHPDNDENFVGMLLVKMLITYDPEDAKPVREFALATLPETKPETSCLDIVNFFQEGKSHMVLVSDQPGEDHGVQGVVTLEDVIEELIGEEIIDESDVFVDVHKGIRRSLMAPRTRVPRNTSEAKQSKPIAPDLININEDQTLESSDLPKQSAAEGEGTKSQALPRRMSGNSVNVDNRVKHRASIDKGQLKGLGPSNLASRPKATRYATVKIKPGADNWTSSAQPATVNGRMTPVRRVSQANSDYGTGIGEGMLKSGGKEASDGVKDLYPHYGAISTSPGDRKPTSADKAVQPDGQNADTSSSTKDSGATLRPPMHTGESQDNISPLNSRPRSKSPFRSKGVARSGSITENVVDANGIRKVVLETASSSDTDQETEHNGSSSKDEDQPSSNRGWFSSNAQQTEGQDVGEDNKNDASASKKKKRRKKRNAKNKNTETEPLLGDQK